MKKFFAVLLAAAMVITMVGCGGKKDASGTIKDDKTLADVMTAVDAKFAEKYGEGYGAVAMAAPIEEQYLADFMELDSSVYDEFAGDISMSMTNSDAFFAVKAKEGKVDVVKQALEKRLSDLIAQYEFYPVSGSFDRAKAGEVYVKGNYVFLIVVGVLENVEDESPDFSDDVKMVKETIDSMFND